MDWTYYAIITFAWTLGGLVSGTTGMGCSLAALPLLNLVMGPDMAILTCCIIGCLLPAMILPLHWKGLRYKELLMLLLPLLPGCVIGLLIFEYISLGWLSIVLGIAVSFFVIWQLFGKNISYHIQNGNNRVAMLCGFLGGVSNTLTGVPGTVTGVYATLRTWDKENILAMQSAYFIIAAIVTCSLQWSRGLYSVPLMWNVACSLPGMALGTLISIPVQRFVNQDLCRKLLLMVLSVSAVMFILRGIKLL